MVSAIHEVNQWGRKDPFTPATTNWPHQEVQIYNANGTAITKGVVSAETISEQFKFEVRTTTNQTTINDLIQNPSTHYAQGNGTDNRIPIASTTDLTKDWWNPTIKTIYDPCPNGYRIPERGTYEETKDWTIPNPYSGLTSGHTWNINNNTSFFPASGYREATSGILTSVGSYSAKWMSTPYSSFQGFQLRLFGNYIIPNAYNGRSYGFPTRCIKEQ